MITKATRIYTLTTRRQTESSFQVFFPTPENLTNMEICKLNFNLKVKSLELSIT